MHHKKGVTLVELLVVLIIIGIVGGISFSTWHAQLEKEYADNVKAILNATWQAEQSFLSYKNRYTDDWTLLDIKNPNIADKFYTYNIETATATDLLIRATRNGRIAGFTIDQNGTVGNF